MKNEEIKEIKTIIFNTIPKYILVRNEFVLCR